MLAIRVMPCLLLRDGGLVKTVRFRRPEYVGDPVNAMKIFNDKEVDELFFLDIGATVERREPPYAMLERITDECFMPLCYGGGINSVAAVRRICSLGVEKVAIGSAAHADPACVRAIADGCGSQSVVAVLDVKKTLLGGYEVWTHSGTQNTRCDPARAAAAMQEHGAGELLVNSIDRDGTWDGYDTALLRLVTRAVDIPVIALGGAGGVADFARAVRDGGAAAVAAGSLAVYQGRGKGVLINFPARRDILAALA